ncbi:MAG: hypothetical protein R3C49_18685 [Planctomycetaceae bacterium]
MIRRLLFSVLLSAILLLHVPAASAADVKQEALPVGIVRAFENLIFNRPIVVTHAGDGSGRVFVAEQEGIIRVFPNDADVEEAGVFLDIDARCRYRDNQNEEGLLGFAFSSEVQRKRTAFRVLHRQRRCEHLDRIAFYCVERRSQSS